MRTPVTLLLLCLLILASGCTTSPQPDRPKILCPACGSELDAIIQKRF